MTIELNDLLLVLLFESLIILVIVLIVLGIKLIKTIKKVDTMVDDINGKLSKLDTTFDIVDETSTVALSLVSKVLSIFKKGTDKDE